MQTSILRFIVGLALLPAVVCEGEIPSIGFAVKGGGHWVDDPRTGDRELQPAWEIEMESPVLWDGRLALVGSFVGTHLDSTRSSDQWSDGGVDYASRTKSSFDLNGGRFGLRYWPWPSAYVRPYLGGGVGYYQYSREDHTRTTATWFDPEAEEVVSEQTESTRHTRRDKGFYPWISAGVEVPMGGWSSVVGQTRVLVEVVYQSYRRFYDADLGGVRAMAGLRWRF